MFDGSPLFIENLNADEDVIVNQGGTSSGKTYSILQMFCYLALKQKKIFTVVGQDIPNLKKGAYRDMQNIVNSSEYLQSQINTWNKSDRIYEFKNGSVIEFNSYSDAQDAKNGKRDYLFINEANGVKYQIYWQLQIRTREKTFLDYNPSAPFWCHEKLIGKDGVKLIISDHRHNPFLSDEEHFKIENIKDKELWKVYARGLTGNISGLIFPNWQMIPDDKFPDESNFFAGLDFGYTNDPTAAVKIVRVANNIYLHEMCYQAGLAPKTLKQVFEANGFTGSNPIYCEHDPDMVSQMRRLDMYCLAARKGKGSILAGITKLKEYNVFYTESSKNLHIEKSKYEWLVNDEGKPTNTTIDNFNHLCDATRYGVYTHFFTE